jgi:signal transduction histidine kinase
MRIARMLSAVLLPCVVAGAQMPGKDKAEKLVKAAIAYAQKNSMAKLIQETNQADGRFHVGSGSELYIFIYDQAGVCKAIGFDTQALVGKNRLAFKDPDGKPFVRDLITLAKTQGHGWIDYKKPNPLNHKIEAKTSYVELAEGLVIGAGIYKE